VLLIATGNFWVLTVGDSWAETLQDYMALFILPACTAISGGEVGSGYGLYSAMISVPTSTAMGLKLGCWINGVLLLTMLADPQRAYSVASAGCQNVFPCGILAVFGCLGAVLGTVIQPLMNG
jgi:hypothetical protein